MSKRFKEAGSTAVFTSKFITNDRKDITAVFHYEEDDTWQFSSSNETQNFEEVARVVSLDEIVKIDDTVLEISDLPAGFGAFRNNRTDKWEIRKI